SGHRADQHQTAVRRIPIPGWTFRAGARRGAFVEPRVRNGSSQLRDVGVVYESGDRAARTAPERRQVRKEGVHAAEAPRRAGGAAASRSSGCQADQALARAGRLHRRAGRGAVQAGTLSVLTRAVLRPWTLVLSRTWPRTAKDERPRSKDDLDSNPARNA